MKDKQANKQFLSILMQLYCTMTTAAMRDIPR